MVSENNIVQRVYSFTSAFGAHSFVAGLHNMRPAKASLVAREGFPNRRKCCESSTSNKQFSFQNFFHTTMNLHIEMK